MVTRHAGLCTDEARDFVESLGDLTPDDWEQVAATAGNDCVTPGLRLLARENGAGVIAWCLDDWIDTAVWLCRQRGASVPRIEAVRAAALALLVRPLLGESRFRLLYAPFAGVIPASRWSAVLNTDGASLYGIFVRSGRLAGERSKVASGLLP